MQSCDVLPRHRHPSFVARMARACEYGMRAINPDHVEDPQEPSVVQDIAHNVADMLTAAAYVDVDLSLNMLGRAVTLPPLPSLTPIPPIPDDNANLPLREAAELLESVCRALEDSLNTTVDAPWKRPSECEHEGSAFVLILLETELCHTLCCKTRRQKATALRAHSRVADPGNPANLHLSSRSRSRSSGRSRRARAFAIESA